MILVYHELRELLYEYFIEQGYTSHDVIEFKIDDTLGEIETEEFTDEGF